VTENAVPRYDILIIGGGINGTAIARAAALAGKTVLLVEKDDLAQATSSASTKLMHGGLRYLEYYEFKLVREALKERAIMLHTAPHLVRPLEFRLPHDTSVRPWWMVRAGLLLYDFFALGGGLPRSRGVLMDDPELQTTTKRGFSYYDGWVDDARLVALNARDAADLGALITTRTRFVSAQRHTDEWHVQIADEHGLQSTTAQILVNAGGPWVDRVLREGIGVNTASHLRLVRGSHLIVKRCFKGEYAWLLQQPDGRVVFAIPYLDDFTLIGTTDTVVENAEDNKISPAESAYLLAAVNRYRRSPISSDDVIADYAGIRPLFDDGAGDAKAVSRDYHLELDAEKPQLLSVFGGKITTARHLAAEVLQCLGIDGGDTAARPIPGGDFADFDQFISDVIARWPFLNTKTMHRMARAYGTRIQNILGDACALTDMGSDFGAGLYAREVDYLIDQEWAHSADDILWRRTKLGMFFLPDQVAALQQHCVQRLSRRVRNLDQ
jgi:glycerol-3-phosphate dehydrogenase